MTQTQLPPGPRRSPWDMYTTMFDPDVAIARAVRRFGDPFTSYVVPQPTVVSCTPEGARRLLTADPDSFEVPDPEMMGPLVGDNSLLLLIGERHRAERKLLNPHFHGGRMRAYGSLMREIALEHAASWRVSEVFRVLDATQSISLEVIIRAVFGVDSERIEEFRSAVRTFVSAFTPPLVFLRGLRREFHGFGPWARFVRAREALDRLLDAEVTRRRATAPGQDILSLLLAARYEDGSPLSWQQLRDELVTLLFAGHETTALGMAWALYHLHRAPEALARVRAEVAALGDSPDPDELAQLPYLAAVCSETLRLHPVAPILPPRQPREPFEFLGYTLPPGVLLTIGTTRLHKREDLYPAPLAFRPERFLQRTFSPFEYMPFGGGPRRCIGAAFALYEMKIVLATLLSTCRLSLASDEPERERRRSAVMAPSRGVPMLLTGRV